MAHSDWQGFWLKCVFLFYSFLFLWGGEGGAPAEWYCSCSYCRTFLINVLVELGTPYDSNDCTAHVSCENVSWFFVIHLDGQNKIVIVTLSILLHNLWQVPPCLTHSTLCLPLKSLHNIPMLFIHVAVKYYIFCRTFRLLCNHEEILERSVGK